MADNEEKKVNAATETAPEENTEKHDCGCGCGCGCQKKTRRQKLIKICSTILIALAVVLLLVLWQIDRVVATSTRTIGSMLTGTKVDVKDVTIRPLLGLVKLKGFSVGNPEGFLNPEAIHVENFHVDAGMKSLFSDKMEVEHLEITGVEINFEYTLSQGSNLDVILKNVEKATGADKKKTQADKADTQKEEKAPAKQVVIRKLILKDAKVTVSSGMLKTNMVIPLLPIEMENVGEGKDLAGTISEVLTRIITDIGKVITSAGSGIVSGLDSAADATGKTINKTLDGSWKMIKKLPGLGK